MYLITDSDKSEAADINISAGVTNSAPSFTAGPSDGGSSSSTPTTVGNNVTFTATATDANGEQYYLAICKTDAVSPGNDAAPTCTGGSWAISTATNSAAQASVNYTTSASDVATNIWYAFVCDKVVGGGVCSSSSQGSGDNGSPFVIDSEPSLMSAIKAVEYSDTTDENPEPNERLAFDLEVAHNASDQVTAVICDTTFTQGSKSCDSEELCRVVASTWRDQTSGTGNDLEGVFFNSSTVGWAAGDTGAILKTTDAGFSWSSLTSGTTTNLRDINFGDASDGWVVGESGLIRKSSNGGTSWSAQTSGTSSNLNKIYAENTSNVWVAGEVGTILKTTNGGTAWSALTSGTLEDLNGIYFADSSTGWAVGSTGTILKTTDGGTVWNAQTSGVSVTLNDVVFASTSVGWAVGASGTILTTTNGGTTWSAQTNPSSDNLNHVEAISANSAWAGGVSGTLVATSNGGSTWSAQTSETSNAIQDIFAIDSSHVWLVTDGGDIQYNGPAWESQTSGTSATLYGTFFANASTGWATGATGTILKSTDGGASWSSQTSGTSEDLRYALWFDDTSTGWVAGDNGVIRATTNGGTNWNSQTSGTSEDLKGMYFVSSTTGWVVGDDGVGDGTILKTTNGGTGWSSQTSGNTNGLWSISCSDANNCWASGEGGAIINTTNGGTGWSDQTSGTSNHLYDIFFVDGSNGWAVGVGGTILKTTNGGTLWSAQTSGIASIIFHIHCSDANNCWATSDSGIILKTNDGGTTWERLQGTTTSNNLRGLHFVDGQSGWVVGASGTILHTGSGGTQQGLCQEVDSATADLYIEAPEAHGNKAYTVHLFDESDNFDDGTDESQNIDVEDTVPTFLEYLGATGPSIDNPSLIAGATDSISFRVILRDLNGEADVTEVEGIFFDADTVSNTCTADHNDCYIDTSCTIDTSFPVEATDLQATCTLTVYYNANDGINWEVHANPTDGNGKETGFQDSEANIVVNALLAIDSPVATIAYGTVAADGTSAAQETAVGNAGNQVVDYTVTGSDMCTDYPTCSGNTIGKAQQKWDPSNSFDYDTEGYALLATANSGCTIGVDCDADNGCNNEDILVRNDGTSTTENNQSIHWKIKVPSAQPGGTYTGENIYGAIATSSCTGTP